MTANQDYYIGQSYPLKSMENWKSDSSVRVPAKQAWGPEVKPNYPPKIKIKINEEMKTLPDKHTWTQFFDH
jgi:hypothetical protein